MKRGQIYYADLDPVVGHEQGGERPVLIISNNVGNRFSETVIVAAITSNLKKAGLRTHVLVMDPLRRPSIVQLEQIRTIDKQRLTGYVGNLDAASMEKVDEAIRVSLKGDD